MDFFDETNSTTEVITIIAEGADTETSNNQDLETELLVNAGSEGASVASSEVSSGRRRHRPYGFERDPIRRMRHHNRLMRIMLQTINELSTRIGKQAALVIASVGKSNSCHVFGSRPLRHIIKENGALIINNLEKAIAAQTIAANRRAPNAIVLPPLVFGGLPTPVNRMSQTQLRSFIPTMLKYSLGRCKPGWGVEAAKPSWWPHDVPWSNIRTDPRSEEEKKKVSWTRALKQVVINCYNFHSRQDLLPILSEEDSVFNSAVSFGSMSENDESQEVDVEAEQDANGAGSDTNAVPQPQSENQATETYYIVEAVQNQGPSDGTDMEQDQDVVQSGPDGKHMGQAPGQEIQSEDLADGNQIEYYVDEVEQSEQNMEVAGRSEELADENHMGEGGDESEYLAGENRMDYYVHDGDRVDEDIDNMVPYDELTDIEEMEYYVRNAALPEEYVVPVQAEANAGATQYNEVLAQPNNPEQPTENAFQSGEDLAGSSQPQSQVCDSTQSEVTIQKVNTFQSGESGNFPIYSDSLLNDFEGDSDDTVFLDLTEHHSMDVVPDNERRGYYEPEGRLYLRPITAEDENGGDFSYILDLREGGGYSSEDNSREE